MKKCTCTCHELKRLGYPETAIKKHGCCEKVHGVGVKDEKKRILAS